MITDVRGRMTYRAPEPEGPQQIQQDLHNILIPYGRSAYGGMQATQVRQLSRTSEEERLGLGKCKTHFESQ